MKNITFKALAITNEIDLNKIAIHCGIPKKYTWEQPLILRGDILTTILQKEIDALQQVLVFSFGSVVFVNHERTDEITDFLKFIQTFEDDIELQHANRYMENYSLHIED